MIKPKVKRYMKTINKIITLLIFSVIFFSCSRDYDAPPLSEPQYEGEANITIAELKEKYAKGGETQLIEYDYVLKATITGNDKSGNIYKQIYVEDKTGGINIGLDQNSMYTTFAVGQEIFIELHGLYMVEYGDELQIAYKGTQANRIPWETAKNHLFLNGWPTQKVEPTVLTLDQLSDEHVNTFVRINDVYFQNGGKNSFFMPDEKDPNKSAHEELIKDVKGKTLMVRTSSYANFSKDILPKGYGDIQGILGRFRGSWQFIIREVETDLIDFGKEGPAEPGGEVYFTETFDLGDAGARPKIEEYKEYDNKDVRYTDPSGKASIRTISGTTNHVWLPANSEASLKIEGINTAGGENLVLSYELAASLYDAGKATDLNVVVVSVDGKERPIESIPVSNEAGDNNKFRTITLKDIPAKENLTIEFKSTSGNTEGMRLDNITIQKNDGTIVITPEKPGGVEPEPDPEPKPVGILFEETFGMPAYADGAEIVVNNFSSEYRKYVDNKNDPIVYSVSEGNKVLRHTKTLDGHIWLASNKDHYVLMEGIDTSKGKNLVLKLDIAANVFSEGETQDFNAVYVEVNGAKKNLPSKIATGKGDFNKYFTFEIKDIPAVSNLSLKIGALGSDNKKGLRLDNVIIAEVE